MVNAEAASVLWPAISLTYGSIWQLRPWHHIEIITSKPVSDSPAIFSLARR